MATDDNHDKRFDAFCWNCRSSINSGYDYTCKSCSRSFHFSCDKPETKKQHFKALSVDISNPECPICNRITMNRINYSNRPNYLMVMNFAIKIAIEKLKEQDSDRIFWEPVDQKMFPTYNKYVANPMDFQTMQNKSLNQSYSSPTEFLFDVNLILHNCFLFNASIKFFKTHATMIFNMAYEEFCKIDYCVECYILNWKNIQQQNNGGGVVAKTPDESWRPATCGDNYLLVPCYRQHGIVWANSEDDPGSFYPAKVMNYHDKRCSVDLCFFGSHKILSDIPMGSCFLISKDLPSRCTSHTTTPGSTNHMQTKAWTELNQYLERCIRDDKLRPRKMDEVFSQVDIVLTKNRLHLFEGDNCGDGNGGGSSKLIEVDFMNREILTLPQFIEFKTTVSIASVVNKRDEVKDEKDDIKVIKLDGDGDHSANRNNSQSEPIMAINSNRILNQHLSVSKRNYSQLSSTPKSSQSSSISASFSGRTPISKQQTSANVMDSADSKMVTFFQDYSKKLGKQYLQYHEAAKKYRHCEMKLREQENGLLDYYREINEQIKNRFKTKTTVYCKGCFKPATYRCCYNHNYCDGNCRTQDWPRHRDNCTREEEIENMIQLDNDESF